MVSSLSAIPGREAVYLEPVWPVPLNMFELEDWVMRSTRAIIVNGATRRVFLKQAAMISAGSALLPLLWACGRADETSAGVYCEDTSTLNTSEKSLRTSMQYVDRSPHGEDNKSCSTCQFFSAPENGGCGRCDPVKGPINPDGYCNIWSPHPA